MRRFWVVAICLVTACAPAPEQSSLPPAPADLQKRVVTYIDAAAKYPQHVWRDTPTVNGDGTVNGYIEIPRGESTKWEFRIPQNRLEVDRMIPDELGGYPVNYGFLPRTISYDGDPADVLVLGPALPNGTIVTGRIVALMQMQDTGDLDSKVVITPLDERGAPKYRLDADDRERMKRFFDSYKRYEGKRTEITGWGTEADARAFLSTTAGFFGAGARSTRSTEHCPFERHSMRREATGEDCRRSTRVRLLHEVKGARQGEGDLTVGSRSRGAAHELEI